MKKHGYVLLGVALLGLTGCNMSEILDKAGLGSLVQKEDSALKVFKGLSLNDVTATFDGKEHKIEVAGQLPEGATVTYGELGNSFTQVGEYQVTATISCEGYETTTLTATLKIVKADFAGLSFSSSTVSYDGEEHKIEVVGSLPNGASVSYGETGNVFTDVGEHHVVATISCPGYNDLILEADLVIEASDFEGITFADASLPWDGIAHEIAPVVPAKYAGAQVSYGEGGNSFTAVGEHEVTATVSLAGYNSWTGSAKLTITPIDFTGLSLTDKTVSYDAQKHTIDLDGTLPNGATFEYLEGFDGGTYPGTYTVKGVVKGEGHNDLELSATLTISAEKATSPKMVGNFEEYSDSSEMLDDWELLYYNNGWVTPSSASIALADNQLFDGGLKTMKFNVSHQGAAFKATKSLKNKTYKKYSALGIDTFIDNRADGATTKIQVQLWFKDLPLPQSYAAYKDTYATYTLTNDCPTNWTHWEIPLSDSTLSIASGSIPTAALGQLGLTADDLSLYIDKVAVLVTPNYLSGGPKSYAYIDNVQLMDANERLSTQKVDLMGRSYTIDSTDGTIFKLSVEEGTNASKFETLNLESNFVLVGQSTVNEDELTFVGSPDGGTNKVTFNMKIINNGSVLYYKNSPTGDISSLASIASHIDFNNKKFAEINVVDNFESYTSVGQGYDRGHKDPKAVSGLRAAYYGEVYNDSKPASGPIDANWNLMNDTGWSDYIDLSAQGHSGKALNIKNNADWQTRYMSFGLMDGSAKSLGRGKNFSFFVKGSVAETMKIRVYYENRITASNQTATSSQCKYVENIAVSTDWTQVIIPLEANRDVYGVMITPTKANARIYVDDMMIIGDANPFAEFVPAPVAKTITDGTFGVVAGGKIYDLTISGDVTAATFGESGKSAQVFSVEMADSKVTLKDSTYAGAGLTVVADIEDDGSLTISSVSGQAASSYSAFNGAKLVKYENANLDFQGSEYVVDATLPLTGLGFEQFKWDGSKYAALSSSQMRSKKASSGSNKFINMYSGSGTFYKYVYTPTAGALGPVNSVSFKYANNFNAGELLIRVMLTKMDGTNVYLWGDASGATHSVAANEGDRNGTWAEFDMDVDLAMYKSITFMVKSSLSSAYFYIDDLFVGYSEPVTPPPASKTITDGDFYLWNGSSDAYRLTIGNSLTTASLMKCGSTSQGASVEVSNGTVTIKDSTYGGQGLTIVGTIGDNETIAISSVTGAVSSTYSASLLSKTFKKCSNVSLDFEDGAGSGSYSSSRWTEQKYTNSWVDVSSPEMNSRFDASNSKVANMSCDGSARNFNYTPALPMGPVNNLNIDLGNYYGSAAGAISYKIAIIDGGGNKTYVVGDASNWGTLAKDTSSGSVLKHFDLDFNLTAGAKIQITTKCSSGTAYLYMDNLVVSYK